jgi:hypothetical protein
VVAVAAGARGGAQGTRDFGATSKSLSEIVSAYPLQPGASNVTGFLSGSSEEFELREVPATLDSIMSARDNLKDSFTTSSYNSSRASFGTEKLHSEGIHAQFDKLRRSKSFQELSFALDLPRPKVCVRNTFIHLLDVEEAPEKVEFVSAPSVMMTKPFSTKYPRMEPDHIRGDCRPCAYFLHKTDGCRWGDDCTFCHLCPPAALKRKKREKLKAMKDTKKDKRHGRSRSSAAS